MLVCILSFLAFEPFRHTYRLYCRRFGVTYRTGLQSGVTVQWSLPTVMDPQACENGETSAPALCYYPETGLILTVSRMLTPVAITCIYSSICVLIDQDVIFILCWLVMVNKLRLYSVCNSSGFLFIYGIKYYECKSFLYVSFAVETEYGEISCGHETEEIDTNIQYPKHLTRL